MVLLDTVSAVEHFLDVFVGVYTLAIFLYILASWIQLPYSLRPAQRFLDEVCEPYIRLVASRSCPWPARSTCRPWSP